MILISDFSVGKIFVNRIIGFKNVNDVLKGCIVEVFLVDF